VKKARKQAAELEVKDCKGFTEAATGNRYYCFLYISIQLQDLVIVYESFLYRFVILVSATWAGNL